MAATDERFTPPEIFVTRDRVWHGGADTDPAWHPRSFSRARHVYTKRDDGLRMPWYGRVWLNPPWSNVGPWLARLLEHMRGPGNPEAMILVRNDPPTAWFKEAADHADAIAFLRGRTRYWQWNGRRRRLERCGSPEFASVIFYFGPQAQAFVEAFRAEGAVAVRLRDHSKRGTVARMPKTPRRSHKLENVLANSIKDALVAHALEHPDLTLGELAAALGNGATALMSLRVRDLWPRREPAPKLRNGHNGHPKKRRAPVISKAAPRSGSRPSPQSAARVAEVRATIAKLGNAEFVASDIMDALGCSRQTALRALAQIPEVTRSGKNKSAKYIVLQKGS